MGEGALWNFHFFLSCNSCTSFFHTTKLLFKTKGLLCPPKENNYRSATGPNLTNFDEFRASGCGNKKSGKTSIFIANSLPLELLFSSPLYLPMKYHKKPPAGFGVVGGGGRVARSWIRRWRRQDKRTALGWIRLFRRWRRRE